MSIADDRATYSKEKLEELKSALERHLGDDKDRILGNDTCIYVVGSGGRGEMSAHSDVDLFVARVNRDPSDVDALIVRQAIARAFFEVKLPEPSQGGAFLKMHTRQSLCAYMGSPSDDMHNTLTARMLLFLESQPLLGPVAYDQLLGDVLAVYWKNEAHHEDDYMPFVLVNDIVRYWRILLLNYEHKNAEKAVELGKDQIDAERRLRSYKLRFSRCMMCFSLLVALLDIARAEGNVTKANVLELVKKRPRERICNLCEQSVKPEVNKLLALYDIFLEKSAAPKKDLVKSFGEKSFSVSALVISGQGPKLSLQATLDPRIHLSPARRQEILASLAHRGFVASKYSRAYSGLRHFRSLQTVLDELRRLQPLLSRTNTSRKSSLRAAEWKAPAQLVLLDEARATREEPDAEVESVRAAKWAPVDRVLR